jgi:predicted nucleic acid-binding protein
MIAVVDASVWTAIVISNDSFHAESASWMHRWLSSGHELFSPVLLLAEVAGAVSRRTQMPSLSTQVIQRLQREPQMRLVGIDNLLAQEAAGVAAALSIKGADATYVALARRLDLSLITWDDEQRSRAGHLIDAMTPAEALERMA